MECSGLSVLIPAAGASTRLGQSKQLVEFKGKPLLQRVIDVASSINPEQIIVVTGANTDAIRHKVQAPGLCWVHNPQWADGLGGSIAIGARAVNPESGGLMIMLCDQHRVTAIDLRNLVDTYLVNPGCIVAAETGSRCMPPLIFPPGMFNDLKELAGETGARELLKRYPERVTAVSMDNAFFDLDTPEQLQNL